MRIPRPRTALDLVLAGVCCLADVALNSYLFNRNLAPAGSDAPTVIVVGYSAVGFAALVWRREWPRAVFGIMVGHSLLAALLPLVGYRPTIGPLVALYAVVVRSGGITSQVAVWSTLLPHALAVADAVRAAPADRRTTALVVNSIAYPALSLIIWSVARWVRRSRELAEYARQASAREAVAAERARIARELHDIVAHAVTVMVLQAGGADEVLGTDTARAHQALAQVDELGKQAMAELRRMLVVLRASHGDNDWHAEDDNWPGLSDIDALLSTFRDAALPVQLIVHGHRRELDRSVDLAAYRVVQEALTNVTRHAGPRTSTTVTLTWSDRLHIEVANGGDGKPAQVSTLSGGHGLLGLYERVSVVGGTLRTGPTADGGYHVAATLPVQARGRSEPDVDPPP